MDPPTPENYEHFLEVFLRSQLGIIVAKGIPQGTLGQYVAQKNELAAAMGSTPDGKTMLLCCADRAEFVRRFARPFNAEFGAVPRLKMALARPNGDGIMMNSATSEHTIVIPRKRIAELIARTAPGC